MSCVRCWALGILLGTFGCGEALAPPDYPDFTDALAELDQSSGEVVSPTPYSPGTPRLSLGIFYDGPYSDIILLDDQTSHFYIYSGSFDIRNEYQLVREGTRADTIIGTGAAWLGGGVTWDEPKDLSDWTSLHVSLRSNNEAYRGLQLEIEAGQTLRVSFANYGFVPDGEWHDLKIPLSDLVERGADLTAVARPFVLSGGAVQVGVRLVVDNLFLE